MLHVGVPVHEHIRFLVTLDHAEAIDDGGMVQRVGEDGDLLVLGRPLSRTGKGGNVPQRCDEGGVGSEASRGDETGLLLGKLCQGFLQQAVVVGVTAHHGRGSRTHPIHRDGLFIYVYHADQIN